MAVNSPRFKCRANETKWDSGDGCVGTPGRRPLPRPCLAAVLFVEGSRPEAAKFLTKALVVAAGQHLNSSTS